MNANVTIARSDSVQIHAVGKNFLIQGHKNLDHGWIINKLLVNVEGAVLSSDKARGNRQHSTPLRSEWLSVLLAEEIRKRPNLSNAAMKMFLAPYATDDCFTDNILQNTQTRARLEIFGEPSENICYAYQLSDAMKSRGHPCEMIFDNRGTVMSSLSQILVQEQNC